MKVITVTQTRDNLAEILNQVIYQAEEFLIRRRGEPVAVLVKPGAIGALTDIGQNGVLPSKTAGALNLKDIDIKKVFNEIKSPYGKESLLGR